MIYLNISGEKNLNHWIKNITTYRKGERARKWNSYSIAKLIQGNYGTITSLGYQVLTDETKFDTAALRYHNETPEYSAGMQNLCLLFSLVLIHKEDGVLSHGDFDKVE